MTYLRTDIFSRDLDRWRACVSLTRLVSFVARSDGKAVLSSSCLSLVLRLIAEEKYLRTQKICKTKCLRKAVTTAYLVCFMCAKELGHRLVALRLNPAPSYLSSVCSDSIGDLGYGDDGGIIPQLSEPGYSFLQGRSFHSTSHLFIIPRFILL